MTTSLSSVTKLKLTWDFQNTLDLVTVADKSSYTESQALSNGTGDDQANDMWHDRRTVTAASPNDDLDLAGVLANVFGETLTFTTIRQLLVVNKGVPNADHDAWTPTTGEDLVIGDAPSNPIAALFDGDTDGKILLPSGGMFLATAPIDGWAVTPGSADTLRVAHSGSSDIDYDIIIIGTD